MKYFPFIIIACLNLTACDDAPIVPASVYDCELSLAQAGEDHPLSDEFETLLDKGLPVTTGLQVAVSSSDGLRWSGTRGYADIPNEVRLEPCHRFMIASISKIVTAVLILQLSDEGQLSLDDPLPNWLEDDLIGELANAPEATLRQLLNHTSGIPDYLTTKHLLRAENTPFLLETQREKLRYAYGMDAYFAPGTDHAYSNTNFVLLGLVVEAARNKSLSDVVDEKITQPLNLTSFSMGTERDPVPDDVVRPYFAQSGGLYKDVTHTAVSDAATGDGGILSNMQDLNTFIEALFGGLLISSGSLEEMIADPQLIPETQTDFDEWPDEAYGLGITRYNTPWGTAYGHTGATSSYNSPLFHFPERGTTVSYVGSGIDVEILDELSEAATEIRDGFMTLVNP